MKNVLKLFAQNILIPSGLMVVATLIIAKEEMDNMKIVKPLVEYSLLKKGVRKIIKNKAKNNIKSEFLSMLFGLLGNSLSCFFILNICFLTTYFNKN